MAKIELSRNIILSMVAYLNPLLVAQGYSFSFVSAWGADDKIVLPQNATGAEGEIVLPAGKITINTRSKGRHLEVGGSTMESFFFGGVFIHAVSEGQAYDLLDFLHDRIESGSSLERRGNNRISIYDYTTTGYPSQSAPLIGDLEIEEVRHRYISDLGSANAALRHAGNITIVGMIYVN